MSGVSGAGHVADGVQWPDDTVAIRWRGARPSTVHWNRLDDAKTVHGHGGATCIIWTDTSPDAARTTANTAPAETAMASADNVRTPSCTADTALRDVLLALLSRAIRSTLSQEDGQLLEQHVERLLVERDALAAAVDRVSHAIADALADRVTPDPSERALYGGDHLDAIAAALNSPGSWL
ncbi:hypothetical protein [Streptomyces sp. NPDC002537]